jgi:beta-lactamase class D
MIKKIVILCIFIFGLNATHASTHDCFTAIESDKTLVSTGACQERHSPCSTFKIALSLMGFNEKILIDNDHPKWPYKPEYSAGWDVWREDQTPSSWIQMSTVWYSQELTKKMGKTTVDKYISMFRYGNQDMSGGLTQAWLDSSLQISPIEQTQFIQHMIRKQFKLSHHAYRETKLLLFQGNLGHGWKIYGKTGSGNKASSSQLKTGWFVGWVEKNEHQIAFAQFIEIDKKAEDWAGPKAQEIAISHLTSLIGKY